MSINIHNRLTLFVGLVLSAFFLPVHADLNYYVLNPAQAGNDLSIVSLVDQNQIMAGSTALTLDKNQRGILPGSNVAQGISIRGSGAFSIGSAINKTDMPVPASFAGTEFVIPHIRTSHIYYLLSLNGNASVDIDNGNNITNVIAMQGQVFEFDAGLTNGIAATLRSDQPILVVHAGSTNGNTPTSDIYPVPPASQDLWGVRMNARIGALEDNTTVDVYSSGGITQTIVLNAGQVTAVNIGDNTSQSAGDVLHIIADKPIAAIQYADGDGGESTAFLDTVYLGNHYGIPVDSQYIAVACPFANTQITLYEDIDGNRQQTQICQGDGTVPGKVYFGSASNGVHIPAGAYIESSQPIYLIYEASASNDEHNLLGHIPITHTVILTAVSDRATTSIGEATTIPVLDNDLSAEGTLPIITSVTAATNGMAVINGNDITYTPNPGFIGFDVFTYTIEDGVNRSVGNVEIEVLENTTNPSPVTDTLEITITEIAAVTVDVSRGSSIAFVVDVTQGMDGGVSFTDASIIYTPGTSFIDADTFTYTLNDGGSITIVTATVTLELPMSPPSPTADDIEVTTMEGNPITVLALDESIDPAFTITVFSQAANGSVTTTGRDLIYNPVPDFIGIDEFYYLLSDGNNSDIGKVTVTVMTAPFARDYNVTTTEDTPFDLVIISRDSDTYALGGFITQVTQGVEGGTVEIVHDGGGYKVRYTPPANYNGPDSFTYTKTDTIDTGTGEVSVTIIADGNTDTYMDAVLVDSPSAYWHLDETAGTRVTDVSGNGFDGTYENVTLAEPSLITEGYAVSLDSSSKISGQAAIDFSANELSVCAWIKPNGSGVIVSKNDSTRDDFSQFMFTAGSSGTLTLGVEKGSAPWGFQSWGTPLGLFQINSSHHVCAVWRRLNFDLSDTLFYIDGVEVMPTNFNQSGIYDADFVLSNLSTEWRIGSVDHHDATQKTRMKGWIDEVAIYNYGLSAAQIQQHFIKGLNLEGLDTDADGLLDTEELVLGTDRLNADTDADGLTDGEEINSYFTDPQEADTDGDGVIDGEDIFPLDGSEWLDTDHDGIGNNADPDDDNDGIDDINDSDSDGDGIPDDLGFSEQITTNTYDLTCGLIETIDGPRTDVNDITTFDYDGQCNLIKITNALGHETRITVHDEHGRPLTIIDPNSTESSLSYDKRGRLKTRTTGGQTTSFAYDGVGNIIKTTLPNGAFLINEYDAAQRLTAVEDNLGNRIEYTLDPMGNRTQEDIKDPYGTLTRTLNRVYNQQNRLESIIGGMEQRITFTYDANGNQTMITIDPTDLNQVATREYDALNRLIKVTDAQQGETDYHYDARDNLTHIIDPNGLETIYSYNGFNHLIQQDSPDTQITTYAYDAAGNRISQIDARGVTASYSYDALNRLTSIDYADNTQDVTYVYDTCINGIGRLCRMDDESGTTTYSYDARGNLLSQTHMHEGIQRTIGYTYNGVNELIQITYPSGRVVDYSRNALGQIDTVTSGSQTVASGLRYQPFGPTLGVTYGNGLNQSRDYDLDYRLTGLSTNTVQSLAYFMDAANNITEISNNLDATRTQTFTYEKLNRLTSAVGIYGVLDYQYDATGNRQEKISDGSVDIYSYDVGSSHHLQSIVGNNAKSFGYDQNGNTIMRDDLDFTYGDNNRLQTVQQHNVTVAAYTYNANGQRVKKVSAQTTRYYYNQSGQLIAELDAQGNTLKEYIYLHGQPLAQVENNSIYYYHNDHLGTPQLITDQNQNIAWSADYNPFGKVTVTTEMITNNLRFLGQYFDEEAGLHYNYFRDYDPSLGRYIQSDPIGLGGGINTYGYAGLNPLVFVDPFGLAYFAKRPLQDFPWFGSFSDNPGSFGDRMNTEISHEHLFFEDGKSPPNIGLGKNGLFTESNPTGYRGRQGNYDDCIMRIAVSRTYVGKYCLLGGTSAKNNCQDWADRVRATYNQIKNDVDVIEKCKCNP